MTRIMTAAAATAVIAATMPLAAGAEVLKASHQFPGGKGDARDEMVQMIAKEVADADVDLEIRVYPGESLYKAREQWSAVTSGQLDMTSFPLDYAAGRVPQFSVTLMPGLVRNHERAQRLNDSPFMEEINRLIEESGALVLSDAWLAGGFVSKKNCITAPDSISGQVTRAAGPAFEQMLVGAGASIASMPSSEIYTGMQTGVLDAANTSSGSMVSYRLFEQAECLTAPGENALWFMYEPVLISKKKFERLSEEQQQALMDAGQKAEDWFAEQAAGLDSKMIEEFEKAGVETVSMSLEDYEAWLAIAKETSYKTFAEEVDGGQELIDQALAVE
ncbi:TRAP transporter substrate-binding protein [Paracoccus saliphilus]|uniref:TRAP transporter substrate-binding protein DctP n=1 Tax=Paracoccus saliphilus TaxID=405559 RepID=A0AA46A5A2_9RHOB|nr:TRAP transporter substrate-binding protein DctP [Paracoccus saliphilus]WCR02517.1 TRAP transporter substrate-binding protein DctP [Paracoccus saliphilus]SIS76786.1 TRAP-type C4-dicarboxylate transport system, substrate-binding protein [Paracoccus saliphilus]